MGKRLLLLATRAYFDLATGNSSSTCLSLLRSEDHQDLLTAAY